MASGLEEAAVVVGEEEGDAAVPDIVRISDRLSWWLIEGARIRVSIRSSTVSGGRYFEALQGLRRE